MFSELKFVPAIRPFERRSDGCYKTERHFLDFVVNGTSLYGAIQAKHVDNISPFWTGKDLTQAMKSAAVESAKRLMLMQPADFANNRRSLFICAECGELGCGAVSITVERSNDGFVWRDFGYENDWEDKVLTEAYSDLGPFIFSPDEYVSALNDVVRQIQDV
jgi:hypothetical protein